MNYFLVVILCDDSKLYVQLTLTQRNIIKTKTCKLAELIKTRISFHRQILCVIGFWLLPAK